MAPRNNEASRGLYTVLVVGCVLAAGVSLGLGDWASGEVLAAPDQAHTHANLERANPRLLDSTKSGRRPVTVAPPAPNQTSGPAAPSPAALMLDAYYGADAPAVRAALAAKGIDPDHMASPVSEAEFKTFLPHWMALSADERESRKQGEQAWPDPLTNDFLQAEFSVMLPLGPDELATIDALAKLHAPDIDAAVDQYFDHLDVALAMELEAGRVQASPFLAWPREAAHPGDGDLETNFYTLMRAGQGWVVRTALSSKHHPEAYAARAAVAAAVETRNHALAKSLAYLQR